MRVRRRAVVARGADGEVVHAAERGVAHLGERREHARVQLHPRPHADRRAHRHERLRVGRVVELDVRPDEQVAPAGEGHVGAVVDEGAAGSERLRDRDRARDPGGRRPGAGRRARAEAVGAVAGVARGHVDLVGGRGPGDPGARVDRLRVERDRRRDPAEVRHRLGARERVRVDVAGRLHGQAAPGGRKAPGDLRPRRAAGEVDADAGRVADGLARDDVAEVRRRRDRGRLRAEREVRAGLEEHDLSGDHPVRRSCRSGRRRRHRRSPPPGPGRPRSRRRSPRRRL